MKVKPVLPRDLQHHSRMLGDKYRLFAFSKAIREQIKPYDQVVDIGTGTGILASYASARTIKNVYGLEYFKDSSDFATHSLKKANNSHVEIINTSSYNRPIEATPTLVVTETIGSIGPEENIVEICYEFKKKYPSIRDFIPAQLKVFAVPVQSNEIRQKKEVFLQPFSENSSSEIDFSWALDEIEMAYSKILLGIKLLDAQPTSPPSCLANYELGVTFNSGFHKILKKGIKNCDGVHLYFVAQLSPKVSLSTSYLSPLTHWEHRYLCKPQGAQELVITYKTGSRELSGRWIK